MPAASRALTASTLPEAAASINGVVPVAVGVLASEPAASSTLTSPALPVRLAMTSGVLAPRRVVAFTLAPA